MRRRNYETKHGKPHSQGEQLRVVVKLIYTEARKSGSKIKPAWVAAGAVDRLDKRKRAPLLVRHAALQACTQIAREICRADFEPRTAEEVEGVPQHPMFPAMRAMYPLRPGKEPEPAYVAPEHEDFDEQDMLYNFHRDKTAGATLTRGADALYAWWHSDQNPKNARKPDAA